MKKSIVSVLFLGVSIILSGCTKNVHKFTAGQDQSIRYVAGIQVLDTIKNGVTLSVYPESYESNLLINFRISNNTKSQITVSKDDVSVYYTPEGGSQIKTKFYSAGDILFAKKLSDGMTKSVDSYYRPRPITFFGALTANEEEKKADQKREESMKSAEEKLSHILEIDTINPGETIDRCVVPFNAGLGTYSVEIVINGKKFVSNFSISPESK